MPLPTMVSLNPVPGSRFLRALVAAAGLLVACEAALAQSAECQRYRAELAALDRGGNRQTGAQAERQRAEMARLSQYYRSIGCDRGPLAIFGGPAPAECGPMAQRLRQMEASYAQLAAQANDFGNVDVRRRQLMAAVQQTCNAPQQEAFSPRGFFESLFGVPRQTPVDPQLLPDGTVPPTEEQALGGRRLVCVRTCDGFYFPLANVPGGRGRADEMCQALCPGAETAAFAMPGSDNGISRAISLKGQPYMAMPTALKFQKSFDGNCSCKKEGETWAQVLNRAEGMLNPQRGDIIVTAQKSDELARPKAAVPPPAKKPDPKKAQSDAAETEAAADSGAAAPTASQESAGIGPRSIETGGVVSRTDGPQREVVGRDGSKRNVRVIAPNVIPVPEQKAR
jgi:hypothetical protein